MPKPSALGLRRETSGTYRLRVPKDLLAQWTAYAQAHQDTAAEALRALMRRLVGSAPPARPMLSVPATPPRKVGRKPEQLLTKRRVELRLTPSEYEALAQIAEERECSIQWWVTSLVRAALTRGVTVGGAELKALADSNYQLMAIGRNLNQIAKQLNIDPGSGQGLKPESIQALTEELQVHRKKVAALIYASSERWELRR